MKYQLIVVFCISIYLNGCLAASCKECKKKCQSYCLAKSGGVALNQCWGTPKYRVCKCSDNTGYKVPGCPCEHPTCPGGGTQDNNPAPPAPAPPAPAPPAPAPPAPAPPAPTPPAGGKCTAIGPYATVPGMSVWCTANCRIGNCPASMCSCSK